MQLFSSMHYVLPAERNLLRAFLVMQEKNLLDDLRVTILIGHFHNLRAGKIGFSVCSSSGPLQHDYFFAQLFFSSRSKAGTKQIYPFYLIAECLGDVRQQLAGSDHDPQVRSLIADDVSQMRAWTQNCSKFNQVARHSAEVQFSHTSIHALKTGCLS